MHVLCCLDSQQQQPEMKLQKYPDSAPATIKEEVLGCVFLVQPLDQEYIDRARPIFLLSFSCFIQQLLMSLINLSGKFKFKAMI